MAAAKGLSRFRETDLDTERSSWPKSGGCSRGIRWQNVDRVLPRCVDAEAVAVFGAAFAEAERTGLASRNEELYRIFRTTIRIIRALFTENMPRLLSMRGAIRS